jgi:hypothetical protein
MIAAQKAQPASGTADLLQRPAQFWLKNNGNASSRRAGWYL